MDFKNLDFSTVDKKYLPHSFWFLNADLNEDEMRRQVALFNSAHVGGFFLHARGGLETKYMEEDWFKNISAATEEAKKEGMHPFAYDENGWPSGFADGKIPALGEKYILKSLCFSRDEVKDKKIILIRDGITYYIDTNPYYVDLLDPEVTDKFIELVYEPYIKNEPEIEGFFTDEPQLTRLSGIPWSNLLPDAFRNEYGEEFISIIPLLFFDEEGADSARIKYWRLVAKLFSENFAKKIHEYTKKHKKLFTGHYLLEEPLKEQITSSGAIMPSYRYLDIPGMDVLTLKKDPGTNIIAPYQVASVAHQFGKKQVLTESFAACGHAADFDDLKAVFSWQAVRGVTLLCLHGSPYSMRGLRKRDYPPAIGFQQPWWDSFNLFCDSVGRVGAFISEGKTEFDTLLIHPMTECWAAYSANGNEKISAVQAALHREFEILEGKHILFDMGDELIMEEDATVQNGKIRIGECEYSRVILTHREHILPSTSALLKKFENEGGLIVSSAASLPDEDIINDPTVTYTRRLFDGFTFHYFVNSHPEEKHCFVSRGNKIMDSVTGELSPFDGNLTLRPYESAIIIEDGPREACVPYFMPRNTLDLSGEWTISHCSDNALILDRCSAADADEYVLSVFAHAVDKKESSTTADFLFNVRAVPEKLSLGIETPEKFEISVNGHRITECARRSFFDPAVKLFDILPHTRLGENHITVTGCLRQSDEYYEKARRAEVFESEKNNLRYDTELEALYLVGPFGVIAGKWEYPSERIHKAENGFEIVKMPEKITLSEIEKQGFPFFAGQMTLKKNITVSSKALKLKLNKLGITSVGVRVNGKEVKTIAWEPCEADLMPFLSEGENTVELTIENGLRNLLGPHHQNSYDERCISPDRFYEAKCPFLPSDCPRIKGYNLLTMSL